MSLKTTSRVVLGLEIPSTALRWNSWSYVAYDAANSQLPTDATRVPP